MNVFVSCTSVCNLTNYKHRQVVAVLRADVAANVRVIRARHVERKQQGGLLPDGQLLAGYIPAAGALSELILTFVENTLGESHGRRADDLDAFMV